MVLPRSAPRPRTTPGACAQASPSARRATRARKPRQRSPAASCSQTKERSRRQAVSSTTHGSLRASRASRLSPGAIRHQRLETPHQQLEYAIRGGRPASSASSTPSMASSARPVSAPAARPGCGTGGIFRPGTRRSARCVSNENPRQPSSPISANAARSRSEPSRRCPPWPSPTPARASAAASRPRWRGRTAAGCHRPP